MLISHSSGGCTIHDLGASWFSSGESSLPSLQMVISLLCPHITEWRSSGVSSSSYKGANPIMGVLTSWSHLNWFISQSPYLQMFRVGVSPSELGRRVHQHAGLPGGSVVKNPPAMQEMWVQSLNWEDPLEKEMATHSGIPGGPCWATYSLWGVKRVRYNLATEHWQQQHKHSFHNTVIENSRKWDIQVDEIFCSKSSSWKWQWWNRSQGLPYSNGRDLCSTPCQAPTFS